MNDQSSLPLELTLHQLESHFWEAANILRGSPVHGTDWKSYILPLLFFKRVCDVTRSTPRPSYGADFEDEHPFQVREGCHLRDVRETASNVDEKLQNAMRDRFDEPQPRRDPGNHAACPRGGAPARSLAARHRPCSWTNHEPDLGRN